MPVLSVSPAWLPALDAVTKATFLLGLAGLLTAALPRASAALRHLVLTLALASVLVLPALGAVLPAWEVPVFDVRTGSTAHLEAAQGSPGPRDRHAAAADPKAGDLAARAIAKRETPPEFGPVPYTAASQTAERALIVVWLLGATAIAARALLGIAGAAWLMRRAQRPQDAPWLPLAHTLAARMRVSPRVRFLRSARTMMPFTAGVLRPAVVMPAEADGWPENRLRTALVHELAHVKRADCLTHVVAQMACALHWFNPLVWTTARRARAERERACDDIVLASGTPAPDYADELLAIARSASRQRGVVLFAGACLGMAHRSELEGRLMAILDRTRPHSALARRQALLGALICSCAVVPVGAAQIWSGSGETVAGTRKSSLAADRTAAYAVVPPGYPTMLETPAAPTDPVSPPIESVTPDPRPSAEPGELAVAPAARQAPAPAARPNPKPEPAPKSESKAKQEKRKADPRTVAALTAALQDVDREVREAALNALVHLREASVFEPLLQALKDASPDIRERAAFGLGQLRDRRAVSHLLAVLKDANADVREQAAFALGQLRDPNAVEALGTALRDASADVREQAAFALGQIRDRAAVAPLISALKDASADVREQAAFALAELRDRAALDALIVAIGDPSVDVREGVAYALGELRDPRAIDALTQALKDKSADVRRQAARALGELGRAAAPGQEGQ